MYKASGATACSGMSETDISALKETLIEQQQLLQKLYNELDVEREASATAASEALSMILRLQGERAAVEMEASQYERMAEERICHAEQSIEIFEELIYQKEIEITSLEFQVQAYRYKLLSLGWTDVGVNENRFPENLFPQRCDFSNGDIGFNQNVRRLGSLPAVWWKDTQQKKGICLGVPSSETNPIIIEECFDTETDMENFNVDKKYGNCSTTGGFDSYWEQIRKLDDRVKEISQSKGPSREDQHIYPYPISSSVSVPVDFSCSSGRERTVVSDETDKRYHYYPDDSSCSTSIVQDIFEVPQNEKSYKGVKKERSKTITEVDAETLGTQSKDQSEWIKKMLCSMDPEAKPPRPMDSRKKEVDSAEPQSGIQELSQRIERLENERINQGRSEIVHEGLGEEELKLLKEIREQLNSIQGEMRCWTRKKQPPLDDTSVITVMEAMLHFWL